MTSEALSCGECGIAFSVPSTWVKERRDDHRIWYCPNGHPRAFMGPSEADKLRQERDRLKQDTARLHDTIRRREDERDSARRHASAMKGVATKVKNRVAKGVCPCCNRTFLDLQRHMATKHADFTAEEVAPEPARTLQ